MSEQWRVIKDVNEDVLAKAIELCRERKVLIPTFAQLQNPELIPDVVKQKLAEICMQDPHPLNLFRITWKNEPTEQGGLFNDGNFIEFPSALTGCRARIVGIVGKHFPTGAHKVGAGFGCLVPRLVAGAFDPTRQKAVWPSTGNFCRGGAFDCALLGCDAIAILPEGMSAERFEWLQSIGTNEVIPTPGTESNVKEIYDKCWELRRTRGDGVVIFNQFEEFGNSIWHYTCTGNMIREIFEKLKGPDGRISGFVSATGSAGTIAAGDYLRTISPHVKVVAVEALECPTLLLNGFGAHRIEGIGDKHVPWIHNVRNTDVVCAINDEQCIQVMRLFNEPEGQKFLVDRVGLPEEFVSTLPTLGISGICNLVSAVKTAKYFEMTEDDFIFVPLTDSMDLYQSRVEEQRAEDERPYDAVAASGAYERFVAGISSDNYQELGFYDRKRLHNLKYFTWVEQQGKKVEELNELWNPAFWTKTFSQVEEWDRLITEFNEKTGALEAL